MLEKKINNKISVLDKMFGLQKPAESAYMVPQNSKNDFYRKTDNILLEPADEPDHSLGVTVNKCRHCENMAKNFFYLESLIRTNRNCNNHCKVCRSSLCYLQFVNKSILQVFGKVGSIARAAEAFMKPCKHLAKLSKQRPHTSVANKRTIKCSAHSKSTNIGSPTSKTAGRSHKSRRSNASLNVLRSRNNRVISKHTSNANDVKMKVIKSKSAKIKSSCICRKSTAPK